MIHLRWRSRDADEFAKAGLPIYTKVSLCGLPVPEQQINDLFLFSKGVAEDLSHAHGQSICPVCETVIRLMGWK